MTRADAEYLLEATNRTFRMTRLTLADVTGTWSGLRPLLAEEGKSPSEISRKDETMIDEATGLVSIAGGKLTAYRRMAERIVDLAYERLGKRAEPCRTETVPLPGGEAEAPPLPASLAPQAQSRLRRLYGAAGARLLARDPELRRRRRHPGLLRAEVEHAIEEKWRSPSRTCSSDAHAPSSSDGAQGLGGGRRGRRDHGHAARVGTRDGPQARSMAIAASRQA